MILTNYRLSSKREGPRLEEKMITRKNFMILLCGLFLCTFLTQVDARETMVYPVKEAKLKQLDNLSTEDVFQNLKRADFFYDDEFLKKGISRAFKNRKGEAIRFAISYLKTGQKTRDVEKAKDFHVAKKILQMFPDESQGYLAELYSSGDPGMRRNVVHAVAGMPGSDFTRYILSNALEDKSVCEEKFSDNVGEPLRVCDLAYNLIVLHYQVQNVLRTIGTVHKIEVRDYHIDKLKGIF
jgi:hypothetical protein